HRAQPPRRRTVVEISAVERCDDDVGIENAAGSRTFACAESVQVAGLVETLEHSESASRVTYSLSHDNSVSALGLDRDFVARFHASALQALNRKGDLIL